jgi:ELWxxDGT repeat protein
MKKKIYLLGLALIVAGSAMATTEINSARNGIRWTADGNPTMNIDYNAHHRTAKDIVVAGAGSSYKAFFAGSTTAAGEELWVTDGLNSDAHTFMVKDICSGTTGSDVKYLARFNDKVVFSASDGTNGVELWISDGTAAGTYMVKNINASGDSNPIGMTQVNDTQFVFGATDGTTTYDQLWVSDGTEAGTKMIKDCQFIYPGIDYSATCYTAPIMRVGRKVFFKGDDAAGTNTEALWVTDGTADGTKMVYSIAGGAHIDYMINYYNQKLFFAAGASTATLHPFMSDGTADGTKQISDRRLWSNVGGPCQGYVFYRGDGGLVAANAVTSKAFAMPDGYYARSGVEYKGQYFFGIDNNTGTGNLESINPATGALTAWPATYDGAAQNDLVSEMMVCSGTLWWIATGSAVQSNPTPFKLESLSDVAGPADHYIGDADNLRNLNGTVLYNNAPNADGSQNLLDFYDNTTNAFWKKTGYDAATEADDLSLSFDTPFPTSFQSTRLDPIIGERAIKYGSTDKATKHTTCFSEHYKLTFPGTKIQWTQAIPTGYTSVGYSTTINGRTLSGTCSSGENTLELYGIKGQTAASFKFTFTQKDGTTWNKDEELTLDYFGNDAITDNEVNIGKTGTVLYKSGQAVASVSATDNKTGGYVPSYYEPMKSTSTSEDAEFSNYSNAGITPVSTDTKNDNVSIIKTEVMKNSKIYLMTPSFSDVAATTTAGQKLGADVYVNYAVIPHYLMVTTGPYTKAEMDNSIVKTVEGTINTLQDSWTVSSAPALNLESTGKARIKAAYATSITADEMLAGATDVAVANIGSTSNTNHKRVTFEANGLTPTGIEGITADAVTIIGGEGMITVNGAKNVTVLNAMGQIIKQTTGKSEIDVPSGLYIVRADATTMKVLVK